MMTREAGKKREQTMFFCTDDLVPQDHLLRLIEGAMDFSFIYDLVFVDPSTVYVDSTHVKAAANSKKLIKAQAKKAAKFYEASLRKIKTGRAR